MNSTLLNVGVYGVQTRTLVCCDIKRIEALEMWQWMGMQIISWTERGETNEIILVEQNVTILTQVLRNHRCVLKPVQCESFYGAHFRRCGAVLTTILLLYYDCSQCLRPFDVAIPAQERDWRATAMQYCQNCNCVQVWESRHCRCYQLNWYIFSDPLLTHAATFMQIVCTFMHISYITFTQIRLGNSCYLIKS